MKRIELGQIAHALAFPVLVYAMHLILARQTNYYIEFPWVDMPMHFVGGVAAAYGIDVLLSKQRATKPSYLFRLFLFSVAVAVLWEFGEFVQDQLGDGNSQLGVKNTLRDLFFGTLGSAVFILLLTFKLKRAKVS